MWNPIQAASDSLYRFKVRRNLEAFIAKNLKNKGDSLDFHDLAYTNTSHRAALMNRVIEEIVKADPTLGIFMWPSGPAIVRVADHDSLSDQDRALTAHLLINRDKLRAR
jgi:hypothetical protein